MVTFRKPRCSDASRVWPVIRIAAICLAISLNGKVTYADDIPGLQVKAAVLTRGVDGEKNWIETTFQPKAKIRSGPIYLWTVLSGTEATLNALKHERFWPVRHIWRYKGVPGHGTPDDVKREKDPEWLKVGTIKKWPGLRAEVQESGWFDWRTWSYKAWLLPGEYEISVQIVEGPVLKQSGKECIYTFEVVR
jgi:hypothetical protein